MATLYICFICLFDLCVSNLYLPDLGRSLLSLPPPPLILLSFSLPSSEQLEPTFKEEAMDLWFWIQDFIFWESS
jgi:hypothetical protein